MKDQFIDVRRRIAAFPGAQRRLIGLIDEPGWQGKRDAWRLTECLSDVATIESIPLLSRLALGTPPFEDLEAARSQAVVVLLDLKEPVALDVIRSVLASPGIPYYDGIVFSIIHHVAESPIPESFELLKSIAESTPLDDTSHSKRNSLQALSRMDSEEAALYVLDLAIRLSSGPGRFDRQNAEDHLRCLAGNKHRNIREFLKVHILAQADPKLKLWLSSAVGGGIDLSQDLSALLHEAANPEIKLETIRAIGAQGSAEAARVLLRELEQAAGADASLRRALAGSIPEVRLESSEYGILERLFLSEADPGVRSDLAAKVAAQLAYAPASDEVIRKLREQAASNLRTEGNAAMTTGGKIVEALAQAGHSMAAEVLFRLDEVSVDLSPSGARLVKMLEPLAAEPRVLGRLQEIAKGTDYPRSWRQEAIDIVMTERVFVRSRDFVFSTYSAETEESLSYSMVMKAVDLAFNLNDVSILNEFERRAGAKDAPFSQGEVSVIRQMIPLVHLANAFD